MITVVARVQADPAERLQYTTLATTWYGCCVHLYSWLYSVRLLWASYIYEKAQHRYSVMSSTSSDEEPPRTCGQLSPKASVPTAKTSQDLKPILFGSANEGLRQEFADYLVTEFCCENMEYIFASIGFKALQNYGTRQVSTLRMVKKFIVKGSLFELNISESLRSLILATAVDEGGEKTFWDVVDNEVLGLLRDPFGRFRKCGERSKNAGKMKEPKFSDVLAKEAIMRRKSSIIAPETT